VRDVSSDDDKLGTMKLFLAPNVSEARHGFPVYGLGQPTMNGITDFVQALKSRGKQVSHSSSQVSHISVGMLLGVDALIF